MYGMERSGTLMSDGAAKNTVSERISAKLKRKSLNSVFASSKSFGVT